LAEQTSDVDGVIQLNKKKEDQRKKLILKILQQTLLKIIIMMNLAHLMICLPIHQIQMTVNNLIRSYFKIL